ncbi:hypothetical protein L798_11451 [Zootermopsis nevadensis]|uniref:Uncharacterized protein n=1 Tax=Zootermopsis nevadensis TaxID=136037 RepID=A0A067QWG2_ZOONE|nr:hypothetical protein L798_11451 [Zootermopsis nevadensis]
MTNIGSNYYASLNLGSEPMSQHQKKLLCQNKNELRGVSISGPGVPSMAGHREQDSNKSRQTRCGGTVDNSRSRGRRSSSRSPRSQTATRNIKVEPRPPPLLVQNLLETLK